MIRVLVADDHGVVRKGLRLVLSEDPGLEIVGEACDGEQAMAMTETLAPAVVILDVAMPKRNGLQPAALITRSCPHTAILMLSRYSDEEYLLRAISAGAKGYLLKDSAEPDLIAAVRAVAAGKPFFAPVLNEALVASYVRKIQTDGLRDSYDALTEREKEVLQLLANAKTSKEIAAQLQLRLHTVETHRTNLMQKLGLHSAAEVVLYAARKKLLV
ncbi:MAG: response regulator transcription factor [Acidobacteria bacterium]|jgi:DNA-binding NarL/FixJ family response regulator|nr:response regulator transcription factor [Bryobacteraceae bacterium CoA2 C42]